jgi:hypothetical protein
MKMRTVIPAAVASAVLGLAGAATAQSVGAVGAGVANASDRGAVASGLVGAAVEAPQDRRDDRRERNRDRRNRDREAQQPQPNATSTYGAGSVYTDRNSTSAAVTSGGSASGSGVASTSSTVDAYGETSREGTSADIYGNSTATVGQTPRRPRPQ